MKLFFFCTIVPAAILAVILGMSWLAEHQWRLGFVLSLFGLIMWFLDLQFRRVDRRLKSLEKEIEAMRIGQSGDVIASADAPARPDATA